VRRRFPEVSLGDRRGEEVRIRSDSLEKYKAVELDPKSLAAPIRHGLVFFQGSALWNAQELAPMDPPRHDQLAQMTDLIECPKCGHPNSQLAHFCRNCHAVLIRRCPNCWHEQRNGIVCEQCGTNIPLAVELAFENSIKEDARIQRDKTIARAATVWELALLPFTSLTGVLRALVLRLAASLLNR
jgi:DNA-directed RNA polymerase subunit M/transcription elongation factor TFIIS